MKGGLREGGGVGGDSSPLEIYRASSPLEIYPGQLLSKLASSPLEIYPGQLLSKLPNCLSQTVRQSYLRLGCAKGSNRDKEFFFCFMHFRFGPSVGRILAWTLISAACWQCCVQKKKEINANA